MLPTLNFDKYSSWKCGLKARAAVSDGSVTRDSITTTNRGLSNPLDLITTTPPPVRTAVDQHEVDNDQ